MTSTDKGVLTCQALLSLTTMHGHAVGCRVSLVQATTDAIDISVSAIE